ncbi:hypothetical protein NQZ68_017492, partial [Dissostichus eleginoides]
LGNKWMVQRDTRLFLRMRFLLPDLYKNSPAEDRMCQSTSETNNWKHAQYFYEEKKANDLHAWWGKPSW